MSMEEELKDEERKNHDHNCEEYLAGWKRAQADYANLRKDTERERQEFVKYANERLLQTFLPAIDQYETALAYTPSIENLPVEDQKRLKNWLIGFQAVKALWESSFKDIGLERVPVKGTFDPRIHEAVAHEAGESVGKGEIIRAVEDGWQLNGKLLRPAKVVVANDINDNQEQEK